MDIIYTPSFIRQLKKLSKEIQDEALLKIEWLQESMYLESLKIHKLHGRLAGQWSLSVTYQYRILFVYGAEPNSIILTAIGDHSIYK